MRTYKVTKTRQGRPKVTLYQHGQVMLACTTTTRARAFTLGRAWADSDTTTPALAGAA